MLDQLFLQKVQILSQSPFSIIIWPTQMTTKNNQSSKKFRLQRIDECVFIAFRKFYGKFYTLISPKIIKPACNRKDSK